MEKKQKLHYAWIVMIAAICLKIGEGAIGASVGNFVTPVVSDLGCLVSQFTLFMSIDAMGMALFYTTAAKWISTKRVGIVMGVAVVLEVIGLAMMSTYNKVWMFYFSGALIGSAGAFTGFVAIPILINMWFKKKSGTVLGIVMGVSSAAGLVFGQLSAWLITQYGWRQAYLILAIILAVFAVLPVFLLIKSPAEAGVEPYGAEEIALEETKAETPIADSSYGLSRKEALRYVPFWLSWIVCVCYSYACSIPGYIANCATMELGQTIQFGATASTFCSLGCIIASVATGHINDKFGVKAGMAWGALFNILGFGTILLGFKNPGLLLPGAFLVGIGGSMYTVQAPLLARNVVGEKHYSEVWSMMMVVNSLIGGGFAFTIGWFYDFGHTYRGAFILGPVLYIVALILGVIAINQTKNKQNA